MVLLHQEKEHSNPWCLRMDEVETKRIASLKFGVKGWPVEIRALRSWNPRFRPNETCYVFVDRYGDAIQAIAQGKAQKHIEAKINLGMCYRIEGYACIDPKRHVNMLSHPVNMIVGQTSSIVPIPDTDDLPKEHYNFSSHQKMKELCGNDSVTIDYYGILQQIEDKKTNDNKPFVILTLMDASDREIKAALWEEIATKVDRFDRATIENSPNPKVIALTSMKVVPYKGGPQLNSTRTTYLYLNPKTSATEAILSRSSTGEHVEGQHSNSSSTLFSIGQNKTSLAALCQMQNEELNGKTFSCDAVVSEILSTVDWYYNACPTCLTTIYQSEGDWRCPFDGEQNNAKFLYL